MYVIIFENNLSKTNITYIFFFFPTSVCNIHLALCYISLYHKLITYNSNKKLQNVCNVNCFQNQISSLPVNFTYISAIFTPSVCTQQKIFLNPTYFYIHFPKNPQNCMSTSLSSLHLK